MQTCDSTVKQSHSLSQLQRKSFVQVCFAAKQYQSRCEPEEHPAGVLS